MNNLKLKIANTPYYNNDNLILEETETEINISLKSGANTVTLTPVEAGRITGMPTPMMASLTFWYSFDPSTDTITLCGSDYASTDSTYITLSPKGTQQYLDVYAYGEYKSEKHTSFANDSLLKEILKQTAVKANELIINTAKKQYNVIVRSPQPGLPNIIMEDLRAVYRNGVFLELHDPENEYETGDKVFSASTVFGGLITLRPDANFANITNAATDPKISGYPWMQLWNHYYGEANVCASKHYNYGEGTFNCSSTIIGGHVILGKQPGVVPQGSNTVFIIPICQRHNKNNDVYMSPVMYNEGIVLHSHYN